MTIFGIKGNSTINRGSNSIGQIGLRGASIGYDQVYEINLSQGRYMTVEEVEAGRNVAVLGYEVTKALFPNNENPMGQEIKIKNLRFKIVGVIKREGQSFLGTPSKDYACIIPYHAFRRLYQTDRKSVV